MTENNFVSGIENNEVKKVARPCILTDRLYVPMEYVTNEILQQFFYSIENKYDGKIHNIYSYYTVNNYVAFSRGNLGKLYRYFYKYGIIDKRADIPMEEDLVKNLLFTGTLYTGKQGRTQQETLDEWMKYKYGIIEAPARFGKTLVLTKLITELKRKTLVIAHQQDLLDQFYKTFLNFTNIQDFKDKIGFAKNLDSFDKYQIVLTTWQLFTGGKTDIETNNWLNTIRDKFGLVICDECHKSASACYQKVVNKLNPKYRTGCTATIDRKDEREVIMLDVLGPVVAKGLTVQMMCNVYTHYTGIKLLDKEFKEWTNFETVLSQNTQRNELLINNVIEDIKQGYNVVIATTRVAHVDYLVDQLNSRGLGAINAKAFYSKTRDREKVLNNARKGEINVIVAMRKMLLGIDVPAWSSFHNAIPSANKPSYYQEFSRVRTTYANKLPPVIHDYVDDCAPAYASYNIRKKAYEKEGFPIKAITLSSLEEVIKFGTQQSAMMKTFAK